MVINSRWLLCWFTLLACCQPSVAQTLQLSASRSNPYVGEVITITLDITPIANQPVQTLTVPWWKSVRLWQESETDWVRRYQANSTNTLQMLHNGQTLYAPLTKPGVYQLRWALLVPEPSDDQPLTLGPLTLGTSNSNSISLEIRRPPPVLAASGSWNLGLGTYQVKARWLPDVVALGNETTLSLEVSGIGHRAGIAAPVLSTVPGWEASKVLQEPAGSTFTTTSRTFHFRIRPRQLQLNLPPIGMSYFDPIREVMVSERITIPELKVTAAAGSNVKPGHTVDDAHRHLHQAQAYDLMLQEHIRMPGWLTVFKSVLPWIPIAWAAFLVGHLALLRLAPGWLEKQRRRQLLRRFSFHLQGSPVSPEEERKLLQGFQHAWGNPLRLPLSTGGEGGPSESSMKEQTQLLQATLDRWQFGAPPYADAAQYRQQLQVCLADWRQSL